MRFLKFVRSHATEIVFYILVLTFLYIYFVVYLSPSRVTWYNEMLKQIEIIINVVKEIGP